jgi:hypothetical protein
MILGRVSHQLTFLRSPNNVLQACRGIMTPPAETHRIESDSTHFHADLASLSGMLPAAFRTIGYQVANWIASKLDDHMTIFLARNSYDAQTIKKLDLTDVDFKFDWSVKRVKTYS